MTAAAITQLQRVFDIVKTRHIEDDIIYNEGNPATTEITRETPIKEILFHLTGTFSAATANATALSWGIMKLIQRLELRQNNGDVLFSVPGFMLPLITRLQDRAQAILTDLPTGAGGVTTAGSPHTFESFFKVPFDIGNNFSLLDASRRNSLIAHCQWGQPTDVATAGGGGTISVAAATKIAVETVAIEGAQPGQPGGIGVDYPRHGFQTREITLTAAETELPVDLLKSHLYPRVILYTESDNALVDTILNSVTVRIGTKVLQKWTASRLQAENVSRHELGSKQTGIYILDFFDRGRLEEMLAVTGTLRFQLLFNVNKPGTTDKIHILEETFTGQVPRV